ncbi:hypothetical protein PGT21_021346 [Puccinia graminis f. sp. tritici]|uniref:Uncharacterized protein n=1 Tax=Puccinia graminis f. sp. tritici TaxID=56615 RepID=A0A5B0M0R3_PUCGR|nr:hypothetical protein PGT21_021346 [Puccinia graminis f. sp. tritici]
MRAIPNQTDMGSDTFPSRQSLRESAGPNQNTEHEMAQPSWPSWSGIRAIANQTDGRSDSTPPDQRSGRPETK